jgi:SAM-dependent methyltransferase
MKIDLMARYPVTNRQDYLDRSSILTKDEIKVAKQFGKEYFDGDRKFGLGGYYYNEKFFDLVVEDFIEHYKLNENSSLLDIGSGKGFMLHDFKRKIPQLNVAGIDISKYCYENAMKSVKPYLQIGSCDQLPFDDNSFDLVISIATIHNLDKSGVKKSLEEIVRVTRESAFIKVNGYKTEEEKKKLQGWNLVANTILHEDEWLELFNVTGYIYDYDFFVP